MLARKRTREEGVSPFTPLRAQEGPINPSLALLLLLAPPLGYSCAHRAVEGTISSYRQSIGVALC